MMDRIGSRKASGHPTHDKAFYAGTEEPFGARGAMPASLRSLNADSYPASLTALRFENAQERPEGKKYPAIGVFNIFAASASVSFFKENFMLNITRSILALCAIAASGAVFAQTGASSTSGEGSAAQSGNKDPFIQNREEKGAARKEYRKDKSISKDQYKQQKKVANQKLKQSGAESESTKNLEVPNPAPASR